MQVTLKLVRSHARFSFELSGHMSLPLIMALVGLIIPMN